MLSLLQDSDEEDALSLIHRARKKARAGKERISQGITIKEPQEQLQRPSPPITRTSTGVPIVETAPSQPTSAVPTTPRKTSTEVPNVPSSPAVADEVEKEGNTAAAVINEKDTAPKGDQTTNATEDQEAMAVDVEGDNIATEANTEVDLEQPKEQTSNVVGDEDDSQEMTEAEVQEQTSTKESASSAMSDQELSLLKKTNPLAAIKHLLSLSSSSTAMASSGSTTSLTSIHQESTEGLLRQLKAKVLEAGFFARIEKNPSESFAIKDLIQKLFKFKPSTELINFLVEFGPIFETFALQVGKRSELSKLKNQEAILHQEAANSLRVSQTQIDELETRMTKGDQELAEVDSQIQHYEEEIRTLQTKLASAKSRKSRIQEKMKTPKSEIDIKAIEALQHYDEVQRHQEAISRLEDDLYIVESSIAVSTRVLDRLKLSLQNLH